jgi:hypothetical protein
MNIRCGLKRIYLVALVAWFAAFLWFFGNELYLLFLPSGSSGETCNAHFPDDMRYYCNIVAGGDYSLFARVMFARVSTHLVVLFGVPVAVWICYRVFLWIVGGFKPAI